jgi:16S rRNA C967 or C1407 C5-methylase (RsmB/RsmF family)
MKISQPALGWFASRMARGKMARPVSATRKRAQLLEWNNAPPKTFARVNTLKTDAAKLVERWHEESVEY